MSFVAEFTMPPEALPFGDTLKENPGTEIEVERIVPTQESALPFFWVWGLQPEVFMEQAEREPEIDSIHLLASVRDGTLFQAEWSPDAKLIQGIEQLRGVILESVGQPDQWRFVVRADSHDAFSDFQRVFQERGIPVTLERLYNLAELIEGSHRELTAEQREVLIAAYREGYFESPRETTQEELGEQFDISHRAVSDRLRRGTRNLVASTILPAGEST